jgi:hypothetical protein
VSAIVAELRKQPGDGIDPVTSTQIAYTPIPGNVVVAHSFDVRTGSSRVIRTPGDLRRTACIAKHRATCAAPLALVHLPFAQATRLQLKRSCASSPVSAIVAELREQPGDGNCSGVARATR